MTIQMFLEALAQGKQEFFALSGRLASSGFGGFSFSQMDDIAELSGRAIQRRELYGHMPRGE